MFVSFPGNETALTNQQIALEEGVVLRRAPPPPFNRQFKPESCDTVRFEKIRDDNEMFLMFESEPAKEAKEDFTFAKLHEELGQPIISTMNERRALKESAEKPLILF